MLILAGCGSDTERSQQSLLYGQQPRTLVNPNPSQRPIQTPTTDPSRGELRALNKDSPRETATTIERMAKRTADEGDLEGAIQLYRRALALDPGAVPIALALGSALYRVDDYRASVEVFRQALRLEANNVEALRGHANALIGLDRPREAVEQYRLAIARAPRDHRLPNGLGVALDMLGDHRGAQAQYRAALALAADDVNAQNNLGLSLALAGDYDQAAQQLARLVESPQGTARNRQNLALVYGLMGRPDRAAEIGRMDLDDESVRRNLAYYEQLRTSGDRARSSAVMKDKRETDTPSLPGTGFQGSTGALEQPTQPRLPAPVAAIEQAPIRDLPAPTPGAASNTAPFLPSLPSTPAPAEPAAASAASAEPALAEPVKPEPAKSAPAPADRGKPASVSIPGDQDRAKPQAASPARPAAGKTASVGRKPAPVPADAAAAAAKPKATEKPAASTQDPGASPPVRIDNLLSSAWIGRVQGATLSPPAGTVAAGAEDGSTPLLPRLPRSAGE